MALQQCGLSVDKRLKELRPHGTLEFPCAGYSSIYGAGEKDTIPWHWHEELELIYIESGAMTFQTPSASYPLKKGDFMALNSNLLHYGMAAERCQLHSLVFSAKLITGEDTSAFARKFLSPLIACPAFGAYVARPSEQQQLAAWFHHAFFALEHDDFAFEFTVRESLSRIFLFLYEKFLPEIGTRDMVQSHDDIRVKQMLHYIHTHYDSHITLSDIARAADIGERECLRCFQKTIHLSPIQYLLKYRIMQGAEMLLTQPASSVSDIALLCGFDSPSNFAKLFRRFYKCSPSSYRKSLS